MLQAVAGWSRVKDSLHAGPGAAAVDDVILLGAADKHIGDDVHSAPLQHHDCYCFCQLIINQPQPRVKGSALPTSGDSDLSE